MLLVGQETPDLSGPRELQDLQGLRDPRDKTVPLVQTVNQGLKERQGPLEHLVFPVPQVARVLLDKQDLLDQ